MNPRKHVTLFLLFVFFGVTPLSTLSAEMKIATIDLSRAFDEFEKTKESDKVLEARANEKKNERDKKVTEIKKLKDELDLLSEQGKEEKEAVINQKVRELQEFDREVRDSLRGERDQMVRDLLKEIDQAMQEYGNEKGYTLILNDRVLLYQDKTLDVTEDILKRLNAKKGSKGKD